MDVAALADRLRTEAERANERRLLVLAGDRDAGIDAAYTALDAAEVADDDVTIVSSREGFRFERHAPNHAGNLLGRTRGAVVFDAHEKFSPNALGQVVGAVDGGGLLVLLTPPLSAWPERREWFDDHLAVPPFDLDDVGTRFRGRLVETLREHPGVAIVDVDSETIDRDGLTDPWPARPHDPPKAPENAAFSEVVYDACLTADQADAVGALEALRNPGHAVVVEADRGRGKSSAAGIAAGALAAEGKHVLVTAPAFRSAREVFVRAAAVVDSMGYRADNGEDERRIETTAGGRVQFASPVAAVDELGAGGEVDDHGGDDGDDGDRDRDSPDVVLVDEAAALPVRLLSEFLSAPAVGFFTTVRGYEGAGRGFSVRFRDRLGESEFEVTDVTLSEPIRYAPGDPLEIWAFRALLLDARPPVDQLVADATLDSVEYRAFTPEDLLADEHLLREVFGLLVLAHYRTEPNDLARLLDAPNLSVRVLLHDGRVVSVALLAREGGLPESTRRKMYDGQRVAGNMIPDVLTSQLRDEEAAEPVGYRVLRIATHHAVRSRGLGSRLLSATKEEFRGEVDWLGVGYGATPELLSFWRENGYRTVHLSTTRNDTSGEYSAVMLNPLSDSGRELAERHSRWFRERAIGVLSDPLRDADPDVVRATLAATDAPVNPSLSDHEWRVVVGASYGPGLYVAAPGAFRRLALAYFVGGDGDDGDSAQSDDSTDGSETQLSVREERLLVRKVLQAQLWENVAAELDYVSTGQCMRALGTAFRPLVDHYGGDNDTVVEERARFSDEF
ncbi:tRNA(Met) cytidine acetyltransferase [Haloprofundus marisrubri]|uniref:tRNA(Met) cytidine acetyltransferase TmcA n=1 Tax=Haloprofundus marisrubri TaxID=1514971 RepID=A0A0W1R5T3_9EURY|nr:tRNA(Met) cytidine acetyltransferase TmcA [Haloprofundus marisrubri]KTG08666.1 tRNA(Met) cytidine acetyltransferase [Haloprofundus marisrubri]